MNDRLEGAMLANNTPDPLEWGWLGSEFSALARYQEAQEESAIEHELQPLQFPR